MPRSMLMAVLVLIFLGEESVRSGSHAQEDSIQPFRFMPVAVNIPSIRPNDRVFVTLQDDPVLSGQILRMTDSSLVLSSADAPLELLRQQSLPVAVSKVPVVIHRADGALIPGRVVRVTESQVAIQTPGDARVTVNRSEIVAMPRMGRNDREVEVALRWADIRSVQVGPAGRVPRSLKPDRIVGELAVGGLSGLAGSVVLANMAYQMTGPHRGEWDGFGAFVLGGLIGTAVGSSLGVYAVGTAGRDNGSYGATLAGSTLGLLTFFLMPGDPDHQSFWFKLYALPTLGGVIGFNATRKTVRAPSPRPQFHGYEGVQCCERPWLHAGRRCDGQRGSRDLTVNLVSLRF
ncbi:MAG: hypothetical protein HY710_03985 [Candidatus Latescibacteria bacterium]|nr:hypothetical protein [Candidatus Latescibacterota bacterium]